MNGGDVSEPIKDSAIKLFGAKIPVPDFHIPVIGKEKTKEEAEYTRTDNSEGQPDKSSSLSNVKEEYQTPAQANDLQANATTKADQSESNTDQEKVFKRPDKIIPCPRCRSMDTKFCYFNNYNVNQPRHFCKNCQRYWTAGGTMRNVPVGAGRRKNKHFASQYQQIVVSPDGLAVTGVETTNSPNHQLMPCNDSATTFRPSTGSGTVLKFGREVPLCESMETVLNIGDQKRSVEMGSVNFEEKREEPSSSGSSYMTASSIRGNEVPENVMLKELVKMKGSCNELDTLQTMNCYPVSPWAVPWNPGWNNVPSTAASQNPSDGVCFPNSYNPGPVQWCPTTVLTVPGFFPPNIPLQLVPASYWGMAVWAAGAGNIPSAGPNSCLSPSSSTSNNSGCSGNGSPTLGKHSREPSLSEGEHSEKCVLVPKTLRIDDPDEASRSPIWATLGIKPDQNDLKPGGSIFKGFETNKEGKANVLGGTEILEANPAALSRSHTFQEST